MRSPSRGAVLTGAVLLFWPNWLGHPKYNLFYMSKKILFQSKYPKNILFNFENKSTGQVLPKDSRRLFKLSIRELTVGREPEQ